MPGGPAAVAVGAEDLGVSDRVDRLAAEGSAANRDVPIFMAHGTSDPMIRLDWGDAGRRALVAAGYTVEWHTYPMPHSVVWDEIVAIAAFVQRVLPPAG